MKTLISLTLAACAFASPALSFAQSVNAPITRAQVYADLVRVEQAGYSPAAGDPNYPADIQAAETKIAAQNGAVVANGAAADAAKATSMGVPSSGSSESGTRAPLSSKGSNATCVGPFSFCSLYSGG
jgi:hypothetical protein